VPGDPPIPPGVWGTCPTCGDATPPGSLKCPTCGKERAPGTPAVPTDRKVIRRLKIHRSLRMLVIIGLVIGLIVTLSLAVDQGPPVAADPLTGTWVYHLTPGNYSVFSGNITGGDYIDGNFTIVTPPGAFVLMEVFNSSGYGDFLSGRPATPVQAPINETSGLILFSPIVTDSYFFVWVDQYPVASHISMTLYAQTQYMSNVDVE
jgi:hypothetical protein